MSKKPKSFAPQRTTSAKKFKLPRLYDNPEWVEYSRKFLFHNTKCYACGGKSQVTDHWTAHKNDIDLFWKMDNLIPLCKPHHNYCTVMWDRFNPPKTQLKLEWINSMRLQNNVNFKVKIVPIKFQRKPTENIIE